MRFRQWLYKLPLRLRSLLRRDEVEQELTEELQYHLEQRTREFKGAGLTMEEARRKAVREFGGRHILLLRREAKGLTLKGAATFEGVGYVSVRFESRLTLCH